MNLDQVLILDASVLDAIKKLRFSNESPDRVDWLLNEVLKIWLGIPSDLDPSDIELIAKGKPLEI
jgi:hypothetical protein